MLEGPLLMMTQEEFLDVLAMRRQGISCVEIDAELGYHPATISKWVKAGGPPPVREVTAADRVVDPRWADRLTALLVGNPKLLAKSLFEIVSAEGFEGSYPTVARWVREQRGPRFRAADGASVPIETPPGEEAQFDFSDCSTWAQSVGLASTLWCFGMILCWSRWRLWWFTTSVDRHHTFEGVARFFDAAGGVPKVARTDRMGALGQSQGRRFVLGAEALEFARHHGVEIKACQAGDAKRKGKVERPFRDLKESFLEELVVTGLPSSIAELNQRAGLWVDQRVHARAHRSTGVAPIERFASEREFLGALPVRRFDTDYVETRRVHRALPFITWNGVRYSVPPECLGQLVEARVPVDSTELTVRWAGNVVAPSPPGSVERDRRVGPDASTRCGDRGVGVESAASPPSRRTRRPRTAGCTGGPDRPRRWRLRHRGSGPHPLRRRPIVTAVSVYEQIKDDLGYLQLDRAAECFATLAETAREDDWSHVEFLARLVAEQADATRNRRLSARLRYARFPFRKTISEFDFEFQPTVDRRLVDDLATLRFMDTGRPVLFLGQPGCGKTHLAVALATLAVEAGYRGYFTNAEEMVANIAQASREGNLASKLKTYTAPSVLVIDDVGLLPMDRAAASAFYQVVNLRYEKQHSTIVTTNRGLPDWGEIFGDTVVAAAILDRLMHDAVVFNIKGPSWRLREHQALTTMATDPTERSRR